MTNGAQEYNIAAIRKLLLAAFTPEELRRFCYDRTTFRPVVNRFGPGHGHDDMVDELITYCDNYRYLPELLAELKQANPRQYAHYLEPEPSEDAPSLPTPEILTISHPISLHLVRIPPGEFLMGSEMKRDRDAGHDELPQHPVHVPEFDIGRYPVTNFQYRAFVRATGRRPPPDWAEGRFPRGGDQLPVGVVSWFDAVAFCEWLTEERGEPFRLPTEAEWEKAARGTDGRIYPWGDEPPDEGRCNFDSNVGDKTPIGFYSPQGDSFYKCSDMAGNVQEWCQSLHRPYPYDANDGREDLQDTGNRVKRGGCWWGPAESVRCASRDFYPSELSDSNIGFLVARGPLP